MLATDHQLTSVSIVMTAGVVTHASPMSGFLSTVVLLGATSVGALLPDVDQNNSRINKHLPISLGKLFNHRGMTHSLIGFGLFMSLTYLLFNAVFHFGNMQNAGTHVTYCLWLGLSLGYILHMLEDSWSQAGILWLAPFSRPDQWTYEHAHGRIVRKAVRFKDNGPRKKKTPIRHVWGRGYEVGTQTELAITGIFVGMAILATLVWIVRMS